MFQGVSGRVACAVSDSYPPMSQIEVPVCGRIVNKYDQAADGRTIILNGCLMLLSQRVVLCTRDHSTASTPPGLDNFY
jgi:hypothetical protein